MRTLRVFLPPGYNLLENAARKYPVPYMLDGQNLFDACTACDHQHEWQIDETVTRLVNEGKIEPVIVVGVDNAKENRAHGCLPRKDNLQVPRMPEPEGIRPPDFLMNEVMPEINKRYRVVEGSQNKDCHSAVA